MNEDTNTNTETADTETQEHTCEYCGAVADELLDASRDGAPIRICRDCLGDSFIECDDCGEYFHIDDITAVDGRDFCDNCFHENCSLCDMCCEPTLNDDLEDVDGRLICPDCVRRETALCDECGERHLNDNLTYDDYDDRTYCNNCYDNCDHPHDYHWGRDTGWYCSPLFADGEAPTLSFGVELEMDEGSFDQDEMGDGDRLYHFECDGSLSRRGAELITQPGSLRWHKEVFDWPKVLRKCRDCGFCSHDAESSCGLHVHIGRGGLMSDLTAAKLDMFINRNEAFFHRFARRNSSSYGRINSSKSVLESVKNASRKGCCGSRYQAVNHSNDETVEIRIARGSLKPETVLGTIEAYDGLVRFLAETSVGDAADTTGDTLNKWIAWMCARYATYPNAISMFDRFCHRTEAAKAIADFEANKRKEA